jgi:hypothetical protein
MLINKDTEEGLKKRNLKNKNYIFKSICENIKIEKL